MADPLLDMFTKALTWMGGQRDSYAHSQLGARSQYARDLEAAYGTPEAPSGDLLRARDWRTHPVEMLSSRLADTLVGRDASTYPQTAEGVETVARGATDLLPGPWSGPAAFGAVLPADRLQNVWEKAYERLAGLKGKDPFRVGNTLSTQFGKSTLNARILADTDADTARDKALDYLGKRLQGDIPDEILSGTDEDVAKRLYNEAYREGVVGLRKEQKRTGSTVYDDLFDEDESEGGKVVDQLANVPATGLSSVREVEQAFTPEFREKAAAEQLERESAAEGELSQVLKKIMNPSVRKILGRLDEPNREIAIERYNPDIWRGPFTSRKDPRTGKLVVPSWMTKEIYREKKDAIQIAREGSPGMTVAVGKPGSAKQWQVLRDDLMSKKADALDPAVGALGEGLRDAVREYMSRRVYPSDLARKYAKKGVTQQSLFDALVRLSQDVPGE